MIYDFRKVGIIMAKKINYNAKEKGVREEVKEYLRTYAYEFCGWAAQELTKTAEYAIEEFYKDYTPTFYDRTENIRNSIRLYFHDNGRRVYGGVRISDKEMEPYYQYPKKELFERDPFLVLESVWEGGWHGIYGMHTEGRMDPAPIEIVREKMNDQSFISKLDKAAKKMANSKTYEYLPLK